MEITRRNFIRTGGLGIVGAVIAQNSIPTMLRSSSLSSMSSDIRLDALSSNEHYWRFTVDIRKCIGCGKCVKACKLENDVPFEPEYNRTWVERYVITEDEQKMLKRLRDNLDISLKDHFLIKKELQEDQ